jgi:hypothetical protein
VSLELHATSTAAAHTAIHALVCRDTTTRAPLPDLSGRRAGSHRTGAERAPDSGNVGFMTCESTPSNE